MCYGAVDNFYRYVDKQLPNPRPYCIRPLSMKYRAVYHVLTGSGPCATGPWTMSYWAPHHIVLVH